MRRHASSTSPTWSTKVRTSTSSASTSSATFARATMSSGASSAWPKATPYNPQMVDKAKKRLQGLGFFKTVEIKRRPGSAPDRVILDVELVEQSTGELSFGAGYSTSEGVIGDITISERNLLGRGQFLRLRLSGSAQRQQIDLGFTEPRFLDRNLAAGFDLFHKLTQVSTYQQFATRTTGGSLRLGFPIAENLWLVNSYTLSNNEISDVAGVSRRERSRRSSGNAEYWTSARRHELDLRRAQPSQDPDERLFLPAGGRICRARGRCPVRPAERRRALLLPITDKITFVGRVIGGHIEGWGGQDVRLLDLYYKGGETIRGFYMSGFGPRDTLTRRCAGRQYVLVDDGGGALPVPVDTRRPRHERRGLCGRRIAVWGRRRRQEAPELLRQPVYRRSRHWHHDVPGVCLANSAAYAPRSGSAFCGTRRSDRCAWTLPRPFSRRPTTRSSSSASAPRRDSRSMGGVGSATLRPSAAECRDAACRSAHGGSWSIPDSLTGRRLSGWKSWRKKSARSSGPAPILLLSSTT